MKSLIESHACKQARGRVVCVAQTSGAEEEASPPVHPKVLPRRGDDTYQIVIVSPFVYVDDKERSWPLWGY